MQDLEALIARLTRIDTLPQGSEQATREMAVNPTLDALGWDTFDPGEVAREYAVLDGRVDYCLRLRNRSRILIEVKRTGADLSEHQQQLLRYAFQEGTDLGALTDGLVWWLYLPGGAGGSVWEQRRFFSLDLAREPAAKAAAALRGFLGRDETASGVALEAAQREFERLERARRVRGTLPDAWKRILNEPDDLLVRRLQHEVAAISGERPDEAEVIEFLRGTLRQEPLPAAPSSTAPGSSVPQTQPAGGLRGQSAPQRLQQEQRRRRGPSRRIMGFRLDGDRHNASTWKEMLLRVCDLAAEEAGERFAELVSPLRGRAAYFDRSAGNLREPRALKNGLFVETNLNSGQCERMARDVLIAVRGPHGDKSFAIELAE